jgi:hypothetical protein
VARDVSCWVSFDQVDSADRLFHVCTHGCVISVKSTIRPRLCMVISRSRYQKTYQSLWVTTLYPLLEVLQMRTVKRCLFLCNSSHKKYFSMQSSHNFTPKRNELIKIPLLFITTVFHRALGSCCSRKMEHSSQSRNTSSSREVQGRGWLNCSLLISLQTWCVKKSRRKVAVDLCSCYLLHDSSQVWQVNLNYHCTR